MVQYPCRVGVLRTGAILERRFSPSTGFTALNRPASPRPGANRRAHGRGRGGSVPDWSRGGAAARRGPGGAAARRGPGRGRHGRPYRRPTATSSAYLRNSVVRSVRRVMVARRWRLSRPARRRRTTFSAPCRSPGLLGAGTVARATVGVRYPEPVAFFFHLARGANHE